MEEILYSKQKPLAPIAYSIKEVSDILGISMNKTYMLLKENQFPVLRTVRQKIIPIEPFHQWVLKNYTYIKLPEMETANIKDSKTSYSVAEMRTMLGIKKTQAYAMIKQGDFEIIIVKNRMRVTKESFDKWFHSNDNLDQKNLDLQKLDNSKE